MTALPMILMIAAAVVLMTFMSRKQKRSVQAQQDLQNSLHVGDRVMTTSGLYGTVVNTDDDASIDIEVAPGMTTTWLRAAVREKVDLTMDDVPDAEQIDDEYEELVDDDAAAETEKADDEAEHSKKAR
jgi:preprotein translocase subunit YajC